MEDGLLNKGKPVEIESVLLLMHLFEKKEKFSHTIYKYSLLIDCVTSPTNIQMNTTNKMFKYIIFISVLLQFLSAIQAAKLPKTWKVCKKADPKINDCLKVAIEEAIRDLSIKGNPGLGVLKLDPLHFDKMNIGQGEGAVKINLDFSDLDISGFKEITVQAIKNDWKTMHIFAAVPKLILKGKYKTNGKVLVLPISGDGECELIFTTFKVNATLKITQTEKDKMKYYNADDFQIKFDAEKVHLQFNNLFNGDKALGDNMNLFLNENSKEILQELAPAISKAFGTGFMSISNRIFSKIPTNEISP